MDGECFLSLVYKGAGKLVIAQQNTTIDAITQKACEEWPTIKLDQVVFTYTVGPLVNCSFKSSKDIENWVSFCMSCSEKLVTVNICNTNSPNPTVILNSPTQKPIHVGQSSTPPPPPPPVTFRVGNMPNDNLDEFEGNGVLPSHYYAPLLEKKRLMSDGWEKLIKGRGQTFKGGPDDFRTAIIKYTTKLGYRYFFHRNDKRYIHVFCTERETHNCQWFINAGRIPYNGHFVINQCNLTHDCVGRLVSSKGKSRLGAKVLGKMFVDNVRQDLTVGGNDIKACLKTSYGFDVTYSRAFRTAQFSKNGIFESYPESYKNLPWYARAVKKTNPGSIADLESELDSNHFKRVFIAFHASLEGFKSCRPMLFIDATFTGGRAQGAIMAATAKDGNNGLFPVVFAVVSTENLDNWQWFLEKVKVNVKHDKEIFFISDRHGGLMSAFNKVYDKPVHFFCLQHLKNNLKHLFNGKGCGPKRINMWELFKELAYAPTIHIFNQKMEVFKQEGGERAAEWVDTLPVEKWSLAHSAHIVRYGEMTSNAIESFNFWIINARSLPMTYMIDTIRLGLMRWFVERRADGATWKGALCQHKEEHWNALADLGATWNVLESTSGEYEVLAGLSAKVNLKERRCSCYQWQIRGFPCAHAVAVIRKVCDNIHDVVDAHFFVSTYRKSYSADMNPIPQTEQFELLPELENQPIMLPPANDSTLGRPTLKRKKSVFEIRAKRKPSLCPKCGQMAKHDEFTCGQMPTKEP